MKGLVNFVLKNKMAVWLLTIIITVSGIYSGTRMKMESIPDISIPYLIVSGVYPGASPEQVMNDISMPLEKAIEGMEDVKSVISTSSSSVSQIQVEYDYGVDMDEKKRELESAVDNVTLPENAQEPGIMAISLNMMPVIALSVSSEKDDIIGLTETVEQRILPEIEKIDGVASVTVAGQHINEAQLTYDEEKLTSLGLTPEDVKQMVQASDVSLSLGLFEFESGEEAISVDGNITTVDDLKEVIIPVTPSPENPVPFVKLGDIASIDTVGRVQSISRTNGEDAISLQVVKTQQANTVDVVNSVKDTIASLEDDISGLQAEITLDQGEPIEDSVFTMIEKAVFGGLIAVLIILLFLRDIKSTIISVVSIPVSIFMALLLLNWMGITLNIMTLGAITVAIGRVIDDSIVVVENIFRRMHLPDEPLRGRALVREATIEMFKPILSSTLVTVAVFAPLVFVGGMVGELFMPFALTIAFALGASLVVAITIVPALSHVLFRKGLYNAPKKGSKHEEGGKLSNWYKGILEKSLNHKWITSIMAVVLLAGSLALTPLIGFSFLGSETEKSLYLTYSPGAGELEDETFANVEEVEQELLKRDDVDILQLSITDATNGDPMTMMANSGALLYVIFNDELSVDEFEQSKEEVMEYVDALDHSGDWGEQAMGGTSLASDELTYTLRSDDLDDLLNAVAQYEEALATIDGVEDVTSDAENPYVEHTFSVDQQDALQYGLTAAQIVQALSTQDQQDVLTTVEYNDQTIDVIVQSGKKQASSTLDDVLATELPAATGDALTVGDLVEVEEGTTLNSLTRSEGQYSASVSAKITTADISGPTEKAEAALADLSLPAGVSEETGGVTADMNETFTQLGIAMVAAIGIVYFLLVVTFGEGLAPFAILFSLPFAVIGAFAGLFVTGHTISVSVMMGLLMLIGIVVTNAIVLVDRIIHQERDGMPMREAILEAGATRLRPILMTAIATIGAMVPMALGIGGGGGLISQDLAVTVIGGLFSSTLLTLVIVPIVYEVLSKLFKKNRKTQLEN